jgi:hypothetical protein
MDPDTAIEEIVESWHAEQQRWSRSA